MGVINITEKEIEKVIEELLKVNEATLEKELLEHSAKYAWFAVLLAKAKKKYDLVKLQLDVLEAELGKEYREILGRTGKVTEKAVEEAISRDPRWQEKREELLQAKEEVEVLGALVDAMAHKKDMLVSYCSLLKEQMKTGILDSVSRKVESGGKL